MGLIYFILIYLIIGLSFTYMESGVIRWTVAKDRHNINKKFLLYISYIHITLTFPVRIYGILKKDIEIFENNVKAENERKNKWNG